MINELNSSYVDFSDNMKKIFMERFQELLRLAFNEDEKIFAEYHTLSDENRWLLKKLYPERIKELQLLHETEELPLTVFNNPCKFIERWRNGKNLPSVNELVRLAALFHCSVDYLVGLTDDPNERVASASKEIGIATDAATIMKAYPDEYKEILNKLICTGGLFDILQVLLNYQENYVRMAMEYVSIHQDSKDFVSQSTFADMRLFATAGNLAHIIQNFRRNKEEKNYIHSPRLYRDGLVVHQYLSGTPKTRIVTKKEDSDFMTQLSAEEIFV